MNNHVTYVVCHVRTGVDFCLGLKRKNTVVSFKMISVLLWILGMLGANTMISSYIQNEVFQCFLFTYM